MNKFATRVRTLAGSFVTWLVLGVGVVNVVVGSLEPYSHIGYVATAIKAGTAVATASLVAIGIVRKVTQVLDEHVGLLPIEDAEV